MVNGMKSTKVLLLAVVVLILVCVNPSTAAVPVANLSGAPTTGVVPLTVQFFDNSTGFPTGWAWYFGDENYTAPWTQVTVGDGLSVRMSHSTVLMPDGSIILMGGYVGFPQGTLLNDVWRSTDNGATWTQMTANARWSARAGPSSVAMPDGSIVLMGGFDSTSANPTNDVWRSTDNGATWTQMTASAGWSARAGHSSVAMPDGSIVLMGGSPGFFYDNDVWRSTDNGATWTQMTANAGWSARDHHSSVAMPDGSIVLMGGGTNLNNDVWRSTDNGATWKQMTASVGWSGRQGHSSVAMPDGSIVLMGGFNDGGSMNDVWRSTDNGATWTQMTASAGWSGRQGSSSVAMPDGSIVLIGGYTNTFEVWRLSTRGSSAQNPSHTYTKLGTYLVGLQAYNSHGYNSTRKVGYITATTAATTGVYRPGVGFFLKMDNGSTWNWFTDKYLGWDNAVSDLPVAGDWNRDGHTETGVYRPGVGFYLKMDNGSTWNPSTDVYLAWDNAAGDLPMAGDWNKDGRTETGVYRPGVGFYLKMDNTSTWNPSSDVYLAWDNAAIDRPIAGDWNADGRTETGVYRPNVGFYLKMDNGSTWNPSTDKYLAWDNAAGDLPIAGNFV